MSLVALGHDLRSAVNRLLGKLLGVDVESAVGGLFGCAGVECVDEAFRVMNDLMADAQYFASVFKVEVGSGGMKQEVLDYLVGLMRQVLSVAGVLDGYGLLNTEFRNWLRRVQSRLDKGDAKAVVRSVMSIGQLMHHVSCNAYYRYGDSALGVALFLKSVGDAFNTLVFGLYGNDSARFALADIIAGFLALGGRVDESFRFLGEVYGVDAEDLRVGAMRVLGLCSVFAEMYEHGIVLTND